MLLHHVRNSCACPLFQPPSLFFRRLNNTSLVLHILHLPSRSFQPQDEVLSRHPRYLPGRQRPRRLQRRPQERLRRAGRQRVHLQDRRRLHPGLGQELLRPGDGFVRHRRAVPSQHLERSVSGPLLKRSV
ncbi:hypothetical protein CCHR01_17419 [Colletotrichum chrysophilum]|uniref:Uncharacterized protein n=1 Tax=Colletotrichum chrysophilum TaxID=1836956 RepID=A0AAD9A201_9PEZI|nr:hypothetical protein CCHR01_17419 [Colletotrichum chrysophilum]